MSHPAALLTRKLSALHKISDEEISALLDALEGYQELDRNGVIAADGSEPKHSTVILSGVACRHKVLEDGRRQILSFQYPGDITDLYSYVLKRLDHTVSTLSRCEIARIPHSKVELLCRQFPNLAYALWRDSLVDTSILHAAVINNGRRSATERLAHLLCEHVRLSAVGLADRGRTMRLGITQSDLADATGLSLVHVNKTLRKLKDRRLIGGQPQRLDILDWEGLKAVAGFDPGYLHFKTGDVWREDSNVVARPRR